MLLKLQGKMHCNLRSMAFSLNILHKTSITASKTSSFVRSLSVTVCASNQNQVKMDSRTISLPKLPVPSLTDTMTKYLKSVKPFLNNEEFENTKKLVVDFCSGSGLGPKLQKQLEERALKKENWLADWWLNKAYLEVRSPVVVNSSPGLVFPFQNFNTREEQLCFAAVLIHGAALFKNTLDKGGLPMDYMGSEPLDMGQYYKIFGTSRRPGDKCDELIYNPSSQYAIVAYKNYFFQIFLYNEDGSIKTPIEFLRQLLTVREQMHGLNGIPVGILTSENRSHWRKSYKRLQKDSINENAIDIIEKSLFTVSIDRPNRPVTLPDLSPRVPDGTENLAFSERQTAAAKQMIHGGKTNSGNRWFDKTIQFVVGAEGEMGLTYEHSPAEGAPVAVMMDFIVKHVEDNDPKQLLTMKLPEKKSAAPKEVKFNNLSHKKISKAIAEAKDHLYASISDLDMSCFTFKKFGKEFIKACKLSPDSFIQMAIQAAFYKLHRVPGAHYESASTRMYSGGRTETIRSCSEESLEFAKAMIDQSKSLGDRFSLLQKAVEGHKSYAAGAMRGHGVDRHLLGLRQIALDKGMDIPAIFLDTAYVRSTNFRISTSQVASPYESFMCYGPLVADGYGCCYNPRKNDIVFGISTYNSASETSSDIFKDALEESLVDMQKVCSQSLSAKL